MRALVSAAIVALLVGCPGPMGARGQESSSQEPQSQGAEAAQTPDSPWSFRVSPYMWFAGMSGDVGVNANLPVIDVDVDFSEVFGAIDWFPPPVMMAGEVRYGRVAFLTE